MSRIAVAFDPSRRRLLRGAGPADRPRRPPWALAELDFIERCTRCGSCIQGCPPRVLSAGDGGFPELHFDQAGCSLCGACLEICATGALSRRVAPPLPARVGVRYDCLARRGVSCRACEDECEQRALRFRPQLGGMARIEVASTCSGCGACLRFCPVGALQLKPVHRASEQAA